jgi:hypothetical protein
MRSVFPKRVSSVISISEAPTAPLHVVTPFFPTYITRALACMIPPLIPSDGIVLPSRTRQVLRKINDARKPVSVTHRHATSEAPIYVVHPNTAGWREPVPSRVTSN